jgi:hypothetical protein
MVENMSTAILPKVPRTPRVLTPKWKAHRVTPIQATFTDPHGEGYRIHKAHYISSSEYRYHHAEKRPATRARAPAHPPFIPLAAFSDVSVGSPGFLDVGGGVETLVALPVGVVKSTVCAGPGVPVAEIETRRKKHQARSTESKSARGPNVPAPH